MSSFQITVSPVVNAISVEDSSPVVEINGTVSTATGAAGGDLAGNYPNPTVDGLQGRALASTAPTNGQAIVWNTALSQWEPGSPAASVADGDKGDITVSGGGGTWTIDAGAVTETKIGSQAVTVSKIANDAVQESKIQNNAVTQAKIDTAAVTNSKIAAKAVSLDKIVDTSAGVLLGRASTGTGPYENLTPSADFFVSSITNELQLNSRSARSVMGNPSTGTAAPTDIVAANDGEVLRRSGTTIGFGSVPASSVTAAGSSGQVMFNSGGAFAGDSGLTYDATTDTLTTGSLVLSNAEFITNSTNGRVEIRPAPTGSTIHGFYTDFTTANVVRLGTIRSSDNTLNQVDLQMMTNLDVSGGNAFGMASGAFRLWYMQKDNPTGTLGRLVFATTTNNADHTGCFIFGQTGAQNSANRSPASQVNPMVYVYSNDLTNANDFVRLVHNQTDGTIESGDGRMIVKGATAVRIATASGGFDLPATAGSNGQVLTTDGTNASWQTPTGGGLSEDDVVALAVAL